MTEEMKMKHYQSYKVVEAAQIDKISATQEGFALTLRCPAIEVLVSREWLMEHRPQRGGYFVRYEDGRESCLPAGAFESDYAPIGATVERVGLRTLESHKVNPANDKLSISVLDEPGAGGACHLYDIRGYDSTSNPSDPFVARYGKGADHSTVLFQNGPIAEVGVNGVTHEALLAILIDRLSAFQAGPYACGENQQALEALMTAQEALLSRTRKRMERGVEGTHKV